MINKSQISNWLNSGEYKSQIDSLLTKLYEIVSILIVRLTLRPSLKLRYTIL